MALIPKCLLFLSLMQFYFTKWSSLWVINGPKIVFIYYSDLDSEISHIWKAMHPILFLDLLSCECPVMCWWNSYGLPDKFNWNNLIFWLLYFPSNLNAVFFKMNIFNGYRQAIKIFPLSLMVSEINLTEQSDLTSYFFMVSRI